MGVLPCYREGCENIMCDRYSNEYGYICDECFEELGTTLMKSNSRDIESFMRTPKKNDKWETLDEVFVSRHED